MNKNHPKNRIVRIEIETTYLALPFFVSELTKSQPNYGTLSYSKSAKLGGIKLNCGAITPFSEIANSTIGFSSKFRTFYILGPLSEN
jgi:hypothetical protein